MGLCCVVELSRQVRSIKHSYFAADDRRDHRETERLTAEWNAAEEREHVARPASDAGAKSKLITAARSAWRDGDVPLAEAIVRFALSVRSPLSLDDLLGLRNLISLAGADDRVAVPLRFAADWWGRPRSVL